MSAIDLPGCAADMLSAFQSLGVTRVDTPVIQPAEPFLDMAGEDLRRRIFMTQSETGKALCLRPEFTIPVCLRHIETATGTPKRYAYLGQVFRQRRGGANEFYQAGIEDLGESDVARADARAVSDAMVILQSVLPTTQLQVTVGDQAMFEAVVAACGLAPGWQKRLIHAFGNVAQLEQLLEKLAHPQAVTGLEEEVEAYLSSNDDAGLIAHIDERMEATGYSTNASRSPVEIAARLKEKRELARVALDAPTLTLLRTFLSLDVPLSGAVDALTRFADEAGLNIGAALTPFAARVDALAQTVDVTAIRYRAAFGRPLDYYTGLVFEITALGQTAVLAGGGRFDRLMTLLGATHTIPAVGFALWLDRIEQARQRNEQARGQ
ncbi:ATP phosphoribosyltransferase regulatory subunit [Rhizobium sp. CFBP 8762]|uniref:ATP phosphoribosyltransferase regulatory subunit n=1 Tax=Rhizobium sp. CFBP 8762 TaxID=2775279 RepID=UPI00178310A9|nr:ATP phosphoribosyltransferase regulatory subunit [Rhizobium sp. CFBP 8762]MBD8553353.1 ATP phosphoribosyltransferase regulatory subunit [Rhizobium sp. CFBP 8762]